MTSLSLGQSYLFKAQKRLKILDVLMEEKDYSDVVREAQEIVELSLKGMLRAIGIEPPKIHDVGPLVIEYKDKFSEEIAQNVEKIAAISKWLRREREFSFYGDIDLIPTEQYSEEDAERAIDDTRFVVSQATKVFNYIEKKRNRDL